MNAEQRTRVEQLARERLPANWIAEDAGVATSAVYKLRDRLGLQQDDFKEVSGRIRVNPKLLALHREFAPARGKYSAAG